MKYTTLFVLIFIISYFCINDSLLLSYHNQVLKSILLIMTKMKVFSSNDDSFVTMMLMISSYMIFVYLYPSVHLFNISYNNVGTSMTNLLSIFKVKHLILIFFVSFYVLVAKVLDNTKFGNNRMIQKIKVSYSF